jgi:ABC-2 type transport system permease protein
MLAIYKKELRSYFTSMIGYVFIAFFLVIVGIWFFAINIANASASFEATLSSITFIVVLLTPILTMRLMAEENKQKTDQLLLTSPLGAGSIVIGKLLAVITVFGTGVLVTCIYPLILSKFGTVQFGSAYASILGFLMLGAAYLSMGLYISSLTESQVVAAVISFIVFLFTVLMDSLSSLLPTDNQAAFLVFSIILIVICFVLYRMMHNLTLSVVLGLVVETGMFIAYSIKPALFDGSVIAVFGWLSVISRYDQFYYGIFDITGLIYYLSITVLFAFLTTQVIRKKRWS